MLRRLKMSTKMVMLVAVPLLGMLIVLAVAVPLLNRVKVGGSEYAKIAQAAALKADVMPPPEYLVESMLVVNQLATGQAADAVDTTIAYLESLKTQYYERYRYWTANLTFSDLRVPFLQRSYDPADRFWKEVDQQFIPAVKEGRLEDARQIAFGDLTNLYKEHRAAIDETARLTSAATATTESDVRATVSRKTLTLVLLFIAVAGGVLLLGVAVGRAISLPIRKLTKRAEKAAHEDLPRVVEEVQTSPADVEVGPIEPFVVEGQAELGDLAKAFNSMQETAIRLASDQARMRRNVSEMMANLGRRNQSLLNRTIALISDLEQGERDPKVLEDLFRIDHLTTRIRRNAESLLVLAHSDQSRMWSKPVEIGDVVRTALSAIEAYDRVDFDQVQPVQLRGNVVNDIAHLFAELIENATNFSPPSSRVTIVGKMIHDGYVLSIIDQGLGMSPDDLAEAQRRIDEVAGFDMAPSKVLGLNVVGRIAYRHGINVRLTESPSDGVTAKVRLPFSVLEGRERDDIPPESEEPERVAFAEYASAPVSPRANPPASGPPAEAQSLHDFAMEWTTTLPPPQPGTMFGAGDEGAGTSSAAAEHTTEVATELATGRAARGLRSRKRKSHDITSRHLPPVFDWTTAAESGEFAGYEWGTGAAPASHQAQDEAADAWGVGAAATVQAPSVLSSELPAPGIDDAYDWSGAIEASARTEPRRGVAFDRPPTAVPAYQPLAPLEPSVAEPPPPLFDVPAPVTASPVFDEPAPVAASPLFDVPAPVAASAVFDVPAPAVASPVFDVPAPVAASPVFDEPAPVAASPVVDMPAPDAASPLPEPVRTAAEPSAAALSAAAAPAPPSTSAAAGLAKRVRGAHMPDTGPAMSAASGLNRSAADVRSALALFQKGVRKGHEEAGDGEDDRAREQGDTRS